MDHPDREYWSGARDFALLELNLLNRHRASPEIRQLAMDLFMAASQRAIRPMREEMEPFTRCCPSSRADPTRVKARRRN